jgi:hypothetical protein
VLIPRKNNLIIFMTIAKDFASKAAVAFVALAMIFTMSVPASNAQQSSEDLQKMINDLLAQIATLQASAGKGTASASGYTWTRDLKTGATGADVMELQKFLNADPDTRVAATGAGSAGMETSTFGPATAAAVSKFQVKYRSDILTPAGLVNPTGFFGPSTRAKANALNTVTTTPTPDEDEDTTDEDEDTNKELSGEASLDKFEMNDADDTDVSEGDEEVEIGVATVEFTDGDAEISRLDIALQDSEGSDSDAWDTFDTVSLWVDGEKIAEVDASSKDDYLGDEDDGVLRFSNLKQVAMEDEELEITIAATLQDNLDTENLGEWDVNGESLRFFDADGVATTEEGASTGATIDTDEVATFNIEVAGENEELKFSLSSGNPESSDIVVDETSATNDETILEYKIKAKDGDIDLNNLAVKLTTSDDIDDVISDVTLEVDGQTFNDDSSTASPSSTSTYEFDIDGDVTIDEDDEVIVKVIVDFKKQTGNYSNGTTIKAEVTSTERDLTDAEGADDLDTDQFTGTAIGDTHTLVATGIVLPIDGVTVSADTTGDNDQTGEFTIKFEVTAIEGDFYITDNATASTSATDGIAYQVEVGTGTTTNSGVLSSTADEETDGVFTVREGETETFTLTVTVDTSATTQARVTLSEVNYSTDTDGVSATMAVYNPTPASDFRTDYKNINAN